MKIRLIDLIGIVIAILLIIAILVRLNNEAEAQEVAVEEVPIIEEVTEEAIEEPKMTIDDVFISKDMDLTERTGLLKEDFVELMSELKYDSSGFFKDNAETIYDLCEEYSLNEIFFCGLIAEESGWNIATNHQRTHNYISLMSNGKLIKYNSVEEGLATAAQKLHDNYLSENGKFYNGKTLAGMKKYFCPSSTTWVDATYNRMQMILK